MAINIGTAYVDIVPSTSGVIPKVRSELEGPLAKAGSDAGSAFGERFQRVVQGAVKVAATATTTAVTAAVGVGATALVKGWSRLTTIQDSTAALTISLGSSADAAALLGDVLDTVRGTPFNLDQFARGAQQLVGMGIEAEKVPGYLTAIGEAAATQGGRANEMASRLMTVFGQMSAAGQVQLADIWRISDTGVNALGILANSYGVTTTEMKKMISDGAVPAGDALDFLAKGIVSGTNGPAGATRALAGTMDALRESMSGAVGGISPALARLGEAVIKPFTPAVVAGANGLVAAVDALGKRAGEAASNLASTSGISRFIDGMDSAGDSVNGVVDRLGDISGVAAAATAGLTAFGSGSLPVIGKFLPAINPVAAAIAGLVLATPEARSALFDVVDAVLPLVQELGERLMPVLEDLQVIAGTVLPPAIELFGGGLQAVLIVAAPLADALAAVTGFIAEHAEVVAVAAVAWTVYKAAMVGAAGWSALSAGVQGATASVAALRGAIASIAATRGVSEATASLGVLRATLTSPVSGATAAGGVIAAVAVGAGFALATLARNADQAAAANKDFLDSLNTDTGSVASMHDRLTAVNDEITRLSNVANQSNWKALGQNLNPFDDNKIDRSRQQIAGLRDEAGRLAPMLQAVYKASSTLDVSAENVGRWAEKLKLDPATMSQQEFTDAIREARAQVMHSTPTLEKLTEVQETFGDETATATDKLKAWKTAMDASLGISLNVVDATVNFKSQLHTLTEKLKENGANFDVNTEKGRENTSALSAAISSSSDLAAAIGETDAGLQGASWQLAANREALIKAAEASGMARGAAEKYVNQLGLTPEVIATQVKLSGTTAAESALSWLTRSREIKVEATAIWKGGSLPNLDALVARGRRWGGIDRYATGGIRQAMVGSGRNMIWWDEPETGGEAYVPKNGDPIRSKKVLAEAASWYGLGLVDPVSDISGSGGDITTMAGGGDVVNIYGPVGDDWSSWLARQLKSMDRGGYGVGVR